MKNLLLIATLISTLSVYSLSCTSKKQLPDTQLASKTIQDLIIENGNMPGGNQIDIHQLEIKNMEPGAEPHSAQVQFRIDFTRHPTSGLAPEYQTGEPMRQTEDHQALLVLEKEQWTVRDVSLH